MLTAKSYTRTKLAKQIRNLQRSQTGMCSFALLFNIVPEHNLWLGDLDYADDICFMSHTFEDIDDEDEFQKARKVRNKYKQNQRKENK